MDAITARRRTIRRRFLPSLAVPIFRKSRLPRRRFGIVFRQLDRQRASPVDAATGIEIGGEFRFLGSVEYTFPLTADDMLKGVVFVDYGTTEENIEINANNYRVAPGVGLRISIPAMGPAPLALDLAVPIAHADGDDIQNFSFFFGFGR